MRLFKKNFIGQELAVLEELSVQNIAIVDSVSIRFDRGLTCLTGETGAGKSILANALGLVRGNKAEVDIIRHGTDEGSVSAVFAIGEKSDAAQWIVDHGLSLEGGSVNIRRILRRNGKQSIYIQGQIVTLKDLTELSGLLFDMHGQHEHQNLFNAETHRKLLDQFGNLTTADAAFFELFGMYAQKVKERDELLKEDAQSRQKQEELSFAIKELGDAKLRPNEYEELERDRKLIGQAEKIHGLNQKILDGLSAHEGSGLNKLSRARQAAHDLLAFDPDLQSLVERFDSAYYELGDISETLKNYVENFDFDPNRIDEIEARLALIERLKRKYGPEMDAVLNYRENAIARLSVLENFSEAKAGLDKEIGQLEKRVLEEAQVLSSARKRQAQILEQQIAQTLKGLGMTKARFTVQIGQKLGEKGSPVCGPHGIDLVEFMLSANPGEPLRPIRNVASGGELSRVMLAIKGALAESDQVETLIFDEIDTGIGGEIAVSVGEHLSEISKYRQILSITHLASIASQADNHIKVEKRQGDTRTVTIARAIQSGERETEIARMLSGDAKGASLSHAKELLSRYHAIY